MPLKLYIHYILLAMSLSLATVACSVVDDQNVRGGKAAPVTPHVVTNSGDSTSNNPVPNTDSGQGQTDSPSTGTDPSVQPTQAPAVSPTQAPAPVNVVKYGLRNFQQVNATMSSLTGVPPTTASVATAYSTQLSTSLPTDNDVAGFIASNQVAIFKLAVEYCNALVTDTTRRGTVFGSFNFAATPAVAFTTAGKAQVGDSLITAFWGKDLSSLPPHDQSVGMVSTLIDQLLVGKSTTNAAVTPAIATAACSAVLASAPVTLY